MAEKAFESGGKKAVLHCGEQAGAPLVILNSDPEEGEAVIRIMRELRAPDCSLLVVGHLDWNHDLAPWECPPVMKNAPPFTGGAEEYLNLLLTQLLPKAEELLAGEPRFVGIAGYSLAGLFALYAMYRCDAFHRAASISGSLWFPEFRDFVLTHGFIRRPDRLYLSLGDREDRSRNPVLRTVRENTEQIVSHFKGLGLDVTWELNAGNHFMDAALRTAKGIGALLAAGKGEMKG